MKNILIVFIVFLSSCNWLSDEYADLITKDAPKSDPELAWIRDEYNSRAANYEGVPKSTLSVSLVYDLRNENGDQVNGRYMTPFMGERYILIDEDHYYTSMERDNGVRVLKTFFHENGHDNGLKHSNKIYVMIEGLTMTNDNIKDIEFYFDEFFTAIQNFHQ
jgi:hypothetical protein